MKNSATKKRAMTHAFSFAPVTGPGSAVSRMPMSRTSEKEQKVSVSGAMARARCAQRVYPYTHDTLSASTA
eukprot:2349633-Rhodomonas_salina.2